MRVDLEGGYFYPYKEGKKPNYLLKSRRMLIIPGVFINLDDKAVTGYLVVTFSEVTLSETRKISDLFYVESWKDFDFVEGE